MAREVKEPFGVRLRPSVRKAGDKCADDAGITLGALIEQLLTDHLKASGYLPSEAPRSKRT